MTRRLLAGLFAGVLALAAGAAAAAVAPQDRVLLLGRDSVISASAVALVPWVIGLVCAVVAVVSLRRTAMRTTAHRAARVAGGLVLAVGLATSGACVLGAFVLSSADALLNSEQYVVLHPPAGGACSLIVSERNAVAASGGQIYLVDRRGIGIPVSSWSGDDTQRPLDTAGSGVTWRPGGGTLRLRSSGPWVEPSRLDFSCAT